VQRERHDSQPFHAHCLLAGVGAPQRYKPRKLSQSLEANISELDIELDEEAPLASPGLNSAERILQNAVEELETLIKT
jgi:hypothetical protein